MALNRITLVFFPFIAMLLASLLYTTDIDQPTTISFVSQNVTANEETGSLNVEPINLTTILLVTVVIAVALALCLVVGIKVLGSGISGSVIPIIFVVTILTSVYGMLSALSFPMFMSIPIVGLPVFFFLLIMYVVGLTGVAVPSGGD